MTAHLTDPLVANPLALASGGRSFAKHRPRAMLRSSAWPRSVAAATLSVVALSAHIARADTPYPSIPPAAANTDGGNPTRCARDAQLVESIPITTRLTTGKLVSPGTLELKWSPSCQGNWARFVAKKIRVPGGVAGYYGRVWVTGGMFGRTYSYKVRDPNTSTLAFYTSMVWAPSPSCASAHVKLFNTRDSVLVAYASTGCY